MTTIRNYLTLCLAYLNTAYVVATNFVSWSVEMWLSVPFLRNLTYSTLMYGNFAYAWARIQFINWLNVTGVEDSAVSGMKWIVYTHLGRRYRILVAKPRGPSDSGDNSTVDDMLLTKLGVDTHNEVMGAFGDYHGNITTLRGYADIMLLNSF